MTAIVEALAAPELKINPDNKLGSDCGDYYCEFEDRRFGSSDKNATSTSEK